MRLKNIFKKGFTTPEVLIVLGVISILGIVLLIGMDNQQQKAKEAGVEVDMHTFYVATKSAIIQDLDGELNTKEKFVEKLNQLLDPEMEIQADLTTSNQLDPWGNPYKMKWNTREVDGRTESWVCFTSEGTSVRDGWIFEPDNTADPNRYSRNRIDNAVYPGIEDYRYITLLGYFSNGEIIDDPNWNPDNEDDPDYDPNGLAKTVVWVIGGDPIPDIPAEEPEEEDALSRWAYLTFYVDAEDIELELENSEYYEITEIDEDTYNEMNGTGYFSNGIAGANFSGYNGTRLSGTVVPDDPSRRHYTLGTGYYAYYVYTGEGSPCEDLDHTDVKIDELHYDSSDGFDLTEIYNTTSTSDFFASQGWETSTTVVSDYYIVDITVNNNNIIRIKFKAEDKIADDNWFKVGSEVEITAVPAPNYEFDKWIIDGVDSGSAETINITVEADTEFIAKFKMGLKIQDGNVVTPNGTSISDYESAEEARKQGIIDSVALKLWEYTITDGKATLTTYKGDTGAGVDLNIPTAIDGYPVTSVEADFKDMTFGSLNVPNNVGVGFYYTSYVFRNTVFQGDVIIGSGATLKGCEFEYCTINGDVRVGDQSELWHATFYGANINGDVIIGDNCALGYSDTTTGEGQVLNYATVSGKVIIGDNCTNANFNANNFENLTADALILGENYSGILALKSATIDTVVWSSGITAYGSRSVGLIDSDSDIGTLYIMDGVIIQSYVVCQGSIDKIIFDTAVVNATNTAAAFSCEIGELVIGSNVDGISAYCFQSSTINKLTIQSENLSIGDYAFSKCTLGNVSLGGGVTSIGKYAFQSAEINNLVLDDIDSIGLNAFNNAEITQLTFGNNMRSVGEKAFNGATITQIDFGDGLTDIGDSAFYACKILSTFELPSSLSSIGEQAFYNTTGVASDLVIPDNEVTIGDAAFKKSYLVGTLEFGEGTVTVIDNAFESCYNLTSVNVGSGEVTLGASVFKSCTALESVKLGSGLQSVGESVFNGCTALKEVTFVDCNIALGNYMFSGCTVLDTVELGEQVTSIGTYCFQKCTSLVSIKIPETVTSIGTKAFYNCSALTEVIIDNTAENLPFSQSGVTVTYLK